MPDVFCVIVSSPECGEGGGDERRESNLVPHARVRGGGFCGMGRGRVRKVEVRNVGTVVEVGESWGLRM